MSPRNSSTLLAASVFRRLASVRDQIHDTHAEPIALDDLARAAGISRYHFLRVFQQAFGTTPHQYVARTRIERARYLLATTGMSVTEVCFEVGFSSLGSFSARFSRDVGRSPAAFQREVRRIVTVPEQLPRLWIPHCFLSFFTTVDEPQFRRSAGEASATTLPASSRSQGEAQ